jgi:hypothetical protein
MIRQYLDNEAGSIIISFLLGLGLAALFQKACRDNNCVIIKGPPYKDIRDKIFIQDEKCYIYTPKTTKCDAKEASKSTNTNNPPLTEKDLHRDNFTEHQDDLKLGF